MAEWLNGLHPFNLPFTPILSGAVVMSSVFFLFFDERCDAVSWTRFGETCARSGAWARGKSRESRKILVHQKPKV